MAKLKLTYFDFHGGRGEPARIALSIGGIPFEDERVKGTDWERRKPGTPFGGLPLLEKDGEILAQSVFTMTGEAPNLEERRHAHVRDLDFEVTAVECHGGGAGDGSLNRQLQRQRRWSSEERLAAQVRNAAFGGTRNAERSVSTLPFHNTSPVFLFKATSVASAPPMLVIVNDP